MNRTLSRRLAFWALALTLLLFGLGLQKPEPVPVTAAADNINLALRRTAHLLLAQGGDTTSAIPPVEPAGPGAASIRLEHPFDYHALPALLQAALDLHGVGAGYDVALFDCVNGELLLGYNKLDFTERHDPPCGTREQNGSCYILKITLAPESSAGPQGLLLNLGFLTALALLYFVFEGWKRGPQPRPGPANTAQASATITIGASQFDPVNQALTVAGVRHSLTYREAKLLHLFCRHPNQLLERDFILRSVWADEGILVGRSVDMFVSRLRKLLRNDPAVQLTNVRGVGYRLECGG